MTESKEEILEKKLQELETAEDIGLSIMKAINLILYRWKEKGWETIDAKKLFVKIEVGEFVSKKKKIINGKNGLYS